jgi:hypothetical protein
MKNKHASFTIVNAVVDLCKIGKQRERDLINRLACKFESHEVIQAVRAAKDIGVIRQLGFKNYRGSEPARYVSNVG